MKQTPKQYLEAFPVTIETSLKRCIEESHIQFESSDESKASEYDFEKVLSSARTAYAIAVSCFAICKEFEIDDRELMKFFPIVFDEAMEAHRDVEDKINEQVEKNASK